MPSHFPSGPRPQTVIGQARQQFTHIRPHPYPYQRYAYPGLHRRYFYEKYEPEERLNRTNYAKKTQSTQEAFQDENELGYDEENSLSYTMERPKRIRTTRSVSQGRNANLTFTFGQIKPRMMFTRIDNRKVGRTSRNPKNTQKTSNNI